MLGIVGAGAVQDLLHEAPRCLRELSKEHADGWGVALSRDGVWDIHKSTTCAALCPQWAKETGEAQLVIAHIRKKTVGELSLRNTHPFQRGSYVFAHNGTVDTTKFEISSKRSSEIHGTTDSEKLFSFLLTQIDRHGDLQRAVDALHALGPIGSASFLFSDGAHLYAHRMGRQLFTAQRDHVAMAASEPLSDRDAWTEIPEGALVRVGAVTVRKAA
ncbi:MAG: class II glutamine amidotransferase [Kofleriaceae bacterium]